MEKSVKDTGESSEVHRLLENVRQLRTKFQVDLSSSESLSVAVMNLVSWEEDCFLIGAKTGQKKYYDLLAKIREIRKELLKKVVQDPEGEIWCISKHLLAVSMRLIEVGTKYFRQEKTKEAESLFSEAYNLYALFERANLKSPGTGKFKKTSNHPLDNRGQDSDLMRKLDNLVQELIDCCEE